MNGSTRHVPARTPENVMLRAPAIVVAGVLAGVLAGVVAGPVAGLAVLFVIGVAGAVWQRSEWAAYIYVGLMPFITGIDRGSVIPVVRPSEALELLLLGVLALKAAQRWSRGARFRLRLSSVDLSFLVLVALGSIWPIAWSLLRGLALSGADLQAVLPLWRLAGLIVLFRVSLRSARAVRTALVVFLGGAVVLAVIATAQALGVGFVNRALRPIFGANTDDGRGAATLASSIAVGDFLSYSVALAMFWRSRAKSHRRLLSIAALVCCVGAFGSGQISGFLGVALVIILVTVSEGRTRALVPYLVAGSAVASPVIVQRLSGFASPYGVPRSWLGRVDNLAHFYLPRLGNFRFVLGVSPNSVLTAPETWRDTIFLESGHLWLLWVGGIPMLCAFFVWLHLARAGARQRARDDQGITGAVSAAAWVSLTLLAVLSLIDMHLTLRGASDVLMLFLAVGVAPIAVRPEHAAAPVSPIPQPAGPERQLAGVGS